MPSEFAQVKKDLEALVVKYEKQTGKDRKEIFLGRKILCLCSQYGFSYEEMKQLPLTNGFNEELYDRYMEDQDYYAKKGSLFDKIKKEIEQQIKEDKPESSSDDSDSDSDSETEIETKKSKKLKQKFNPRGESQPIHKDKKYLQYKEYYESIGWCKIEHPVGFGTIQTLEDGTVDFQPEDVHSFFKCVNFTTKIDGKKKNYNFGNAWTTDPNAKIYTKIVFDPLYKDKEAFNLFNKFCDFNDEKKLKEVSIDMVLEHINTICGYETESFEYLLNYFAHIVQFPAEKVPSAIIMFGEEGIGKNTLLNLIRDVIGKQYYGESSESSDLFGKHAMGMYKKMIFCYDESEKNDTKAFMSRLKTLTTSETLRVEPKYMNAFNVQNYCRLFFPTNAREPFQITKGARRWVYLKGSDKYIKHGTEKAAQYMDKLHKNFKDRNVQYSFYLFLKNRDISQFKPSVVPKTEGLKQAIEVPLVLRCLTETILRGDCEKFYKPKDILETVIAYCMRNHYNYSGYNPTTIGNNLQEYIDKQCITKKRASSGILYKFEKDKFQEYIKRYNLNIEIFDGKNANDDDDSDEEAVVVEEELDNNEQIKRMVDKIAKLREELEEKNKELMELFVASKPEKPKLFNNGKRFFPINVTVNINVTQEESKSNSQHNTDLIVSAFKNTKFDNFFG
jgi:hypothetical protein